MSDCNEKDGIRSCNNTRVVVEPLITVDQVRERWLFGVDIFDGEGNELSDATIQNYIDTAVSMIEHELDISLTPRCITEENDYYANDYWEWGYFWLNNLPIIEIEKIEVQYLIGRDDQGSLAPETVLEIPKEWIRIRHHDGQVRLIPNNRFPANLQIGAGGSFFPELFRRHSHVPQLWAITYRYGFEDGKVPVMVNSVIGMIAAAFALVTAGDLIIGAGIASQSLSLDGLSQSIATTSSAENSGYSARIKELQKLLYGDPRNPGAIKTLREFYRGETFQII